MYFQPAPADRLMSSFKETSSVRTLLPLTLPIRCTRALLGILRLLLYQALLQLVLIVIELVSFGFQAISGSQASFAAIKNF